MNAGTEEKPHFVDTSKCAFVLLGSFAHLYEKRGKSKPIGFGTIDGNNIDNLPEAIQKIRHVEVTIMRRSLRAIVKQES